MTKGVKPAIKQSGKAYTEAPRIPKWLDADARAEWKRVMPSLIERRILTESDLGALENYCVLTSVVRQMERKLRVEGYTYVDAKGSIKRNPAAGVMSDAVNKARLFATELGLTPVSRSRPTVTDDDDEDSLI